MNDKDLLDVVEGAKEFLKDPRATDAQKLDVTRNTILLGILSELKAIHNTLKGVDETVDYIHNNLP